MRDAVICSLVHRFGALACKEEVTVGGNCHPSEVCKFCGLRIVDGCGYTKLCCFHVMGLPSPFGNLLR